MERRRFGPITHEVAVIGQGTWEIERGDRASAIAALRRGLDLGMTHLDTADRYGSGAAERMVAEAIAGRRDEVFLVSKVVPEHASRNGAIAPARSRSLVSKPTGWTPTSCTGAASTRWRTRSRSLNNFRARERFFLGA